MPEEPGCNSLLYCCWISECGGVSVSASGSEGRDTQAASQRYVRTGPRVQ